MHRPHLEGESLMRRLGTGNDRSRKEQVSGGEHDEGREFEERQLELASILRVMRKPRALKTSRVYEDDSSKDS